MCDESANFSTLAARVLKSKNVELVNLIQTTDSCLSDEGTVAGYCIANSYSTFKVDVFNLRLGKSLRALLFGI